MGAVNGYGERRAQPAAGSSRASSSLGTFCGEEASWFTQCTFCDAKIPLKTEAERNLLRLKGEMGKTSAEALSIVRGAQVDGWRAVLD